MKKKYKIISKHTWEQLRWVSTTEQLLKLAEHLKMDVSSLNQGTQRKQKIALAIAILLGAVEKI